MCYMSSCHRQPNRATPVTTSQVKAWPGPLRRCVSSKRSRLPSRLGNLLSVPNLKSFIQHFAPLMDRTAITKQHACAQCRYIAAERLGQHQAGGQQQQLLPGHLIALSSWKGRSVSGSMECFWCPMKTSKLNLYVMQNIVRGKCLVRDLINVKG